MRKALLVLSFLASFLLACEANTVTTNVKATIRPGIMTAQEESQIESEFFFDLSKIPNPGINQRMIGTYKRIEKDGSAVTRDFLTGWGEKCPVQYHADKGQNMDEERKGPYSITDCVIWEERVVLGGQP